MPIFTPNVPLETTTPAVEVERLPPGQHRFQLVVVDDAGNRSQPDTATVLVVAPDNLLTVPSVLQKRLDEARLILVNAGLGAEVGDRVITNNQEANTVLRQQPAPGSRAERGSAVRLTIAVRQTQTVAVPRVIGRRTDDAKKVLSDAGFVMNVVAQVPSTQPEGIVVFQNPLPAVPAQVGSTVQVTVTRRVF